MKQEEILIENKTENTALEAQMSETIGITGGIAGILNGTTGQFETLGSICTGVMENTSSIFSIGQMSNASLATIAEGSGSSISLLGQMTDGVTQLVIASDKLCDGVLKLVENTAQIFHSVPNEGARYGKLGPTKIRAEPAAMKERDGDDDKRKYKTYNNRRRAVVVRRKGAEMMNGLFIHRMRNCLCKQQYTLPIRYLRWKK